MQSPGTEKYKIRPGTIHLGGRYESNILSLFALRCLHHTKEDFWLASNADGVGAFDDIILRLGEYTFMFQLKHKEKQEPITEGKSLATSGRRKLHFLDYVNDIHAIKKALDTQRVSRTSTDIIAHIGSFNKIYFFFYTNRPVDSNISFCKSLERDDNCLSFLNLEDSYLFNVEVAKLPGSEPNLHYIKNFYLVSSQIDVNAVRNAVETEIIKIIKSDHSKLVSDDFIKFIALWRMGDLGGHYCLTRHDIVAKLTELLLNGYEINLLKEPFTFYDCEQKLIWNNLIRDKIITVVNANKSVFEFLFEYLGTEVKMYCNSTDKRSWSDNLSKKNEKHYYKGRADFKLQMRKIVGTRNKIDLCDVYKCLWYLRKLPLILKIYKKEQYDHIIDVLKLSNFAYKIIIVNQSGESLTFSDNFDYFENLQNLKFEFINQILNQSIKFQGRFGAKLRDLLDKTMLKKIKTLDIINILLNNYNIGTELRPLLTYYIPRTFPNVFSYDILKHYIDDIFFIEYGNHSLKKFIINENLKFIDLDNSNLKNIKDYHIVLSKKPGTFDFLKQFNRNIHYFMAHNGSYLIWKDSHSTANHIKNHQSQYCTASEKNCLSTFTTVISAGPGMGKSLLIDCIAQKIPKSKWVIQVDLKKHTNYFEEFKNKTKRIKSAEHLHYFKGSLENDLENDIFEILLEKKNVIVLMDGFDEVSVSYRKEVTEIVKSLNTDKFCVCLTTRPVEKSYLEEEFNVVALEMFPFHLDNQMYFLKNYFGEDKRYLTYSKEILDQFVTELLDVFKKNIRSKEILKGSDIDFVAIPLHLKLLGEAFSDDFETYLSNRGEIGFMERFDLVDLYGKFIKKKDKIVCDKFGSKDSYEPYKEYQCLIALRLLFPKYKNIINRCIEEFGKMETHYIRLLDKCGILTVDKDLNVTFTHQTFAEYLAAEWLSENVHSNNKSVKTVVKTAYEVCTGLMDGIQPYPFLLDVFHRFLITKKVQDENLDNILCRLITNGQVDKAKTMIESYPAYLTNNNDKSRRSILHVLVMYTAQYSTLEGIFSAIVEKTLDLHKDIFGYNPIDYAFSNKLFKLADLMCEKCLNWVIDVPALQTCYKKEDLFKFQTYPYLLKSLLTYFAYKDIMLNRVKQQKTIDAYLKEHIRMDIQFKYQNSKIIELTNFIAYTNFNLCYQVSFGTTNKINELSQLCKKIDRRDSVGYAPLHYAAYYDKSDTVDLLLSKGADANIKGQYGEVALHCSILSNSLKAFHKLLYETNNNIADNYGNTPLHYAVITKRLQMIELLLSVGADICSENQDGLPPLHLIGEDTINTDFPVYKCIEEIEDVNDTIAKTIDLFLSKGINVNFKNINGETPLHLCAKNSNNVVIQQLLLHTANVDMIDNTNKETPLHYALSFYPETKSSINKLSLTIDLLITNGANINVANIRGETPLHHGINLGALPIVKKLISYAADINVQDNEGNTPLHKAVSKSGTFAITDLLLSSGADLNVRNKDGETPLQYAFKYGTDYETIYRLISSKPDINAQDKDGNTSLHLAMLQKDYTDATNLLFSNGVNVHMVNNKGETPLHFAISNSNADERMIKMIICYGADVNSQDSAGNTPLHHAILAEENTKIVSLLLSKGADVNIRNNVNETALCTCIKCNASYKTIEEIVLKEADINAQNNEGNTAIHMAISEGRSRDILDLLLSKKSYVNKRNNAGKTPLHFCIEYCADYELIEKIMFSVENINVQDAGGNTALHLAVLEGRSLELIDLLMSNSANVNILNNDNEALLHICIKQNTDNKIAKKIISAGADINLQDNEGYTPLHLAMTEAKSTNIANLLLSKGADVNIKSKDGLTPLHISIMLHAGYQIVENMISHGANINERNNDGDTPLLLSILKCSSTKIINLLLLKGANVNTKNDFDEAPLPLCIRFHVGYEIIEKIILSGADINMQDSEGNTPLHLAIAESRNADIIILLLTKGANVNMKNNVGNTPLHYICIKQNADYKIIQQIIAFGANMNVQNGEGDTPLHLAIAENRSVDTIKLLLSKGADANIKNNFGETPLHGVCIESNTDYKIVKEILLSEANINLQDTDGNTPLHLAIRESRSMEIIELLLSEGADVSVKNIHGDTILHSICRKQNVDYRFVEKIIEVGANINVQNCVGDTPLHVAIAENRSTSVIKLLILKGADVNAKNVLGDTSLHYIFIHQNGNYKIVEKIISSGADIKARNGDGDTPLHLAIAKYSGKNIINLLLLKGADINARNYNYKTPLHICIQQDADYEVIEKLVLSGVDIDVQDHKGDTPLHLVVAKCKITDVMNLLLSNGANVNIGNYYHETTLHIAIQQDADYKIIEKIISCGADMNVRDRKGDTPLHLAIAKHRSECIFNLLLSKGADVNVENCHHETPLHICIQQNSYYRIIEEIILHGADVNVCDCKGDTPLHLAITKRRSGEIINLLLSKGADVNIKNYYCETPLLLCIQQNADYKIIEKMILFGADINVQNHEQDTPLHLATVEYRSVNIINLLLSKGADANMKDSLGNTALHYSCIKDYDDYEVTEEIISLGADLDVRNYEMIAEDRDVDMVDQSLSNGELPVHYLALQNVDYKIIKNIISSGADINLQDDEGNTPLHIAIAENRSVDIIDLFLSKGTDVTRSNNDGETPLHICIKNNVSYEIIEKVILSAADINVQDSIGNTPLHLAVAVNSTNSIISLLLSRKADVNIRNFKGKTPLDFCERLDVDLGEF